MLIKQADIMELTKLANDLESAGFYRQATNVDALIKEASWWSDFYNSKINPLMGYLKNWGANKLSDYINKNPESAVGKFVKNTMGISYNPSAQEITDYVNNFFKKPEMAVNKDEILSTAIASGRMVRIYYTRKSDGMSDNYEVFPKEIRGDKLWAEHPVHNNKVHSFIMSNIKNAQMI